VFLNPWSKEECETFAKLIGFDEDEWIWKFNLVGGKPRFVFSSYTLDDLLVRVNKDIPHDFNALKLQVRLFEQNTFHHNMKHIVFSIYRDEARPSLFCLTYSSLVVEATMEIRYKTESADKIRSLLQTPAANLQSWRGKEIEKFLLQDLATATFRVKSLEGPNFGNVTRLGPFKAKSKIIHTASEIENELMLYIPLSKTFPAIDGVLVVPSNSLVIYAQSTVSAAHPIKYSRLKEVYSNLMEQGRFQDYKHILLFVVSADIFDGFSFQPYKNFDGKQDRDKKIDIQIEQYVGTTF
jgi:hypothetical protein